MVLRSAPKSDINESVCFTVVVFAAYNLPVTKANIHLCPKPSIRKSSGPQTISAHSCCFRAGKPKPALLAFSGGPNFTTLGVLGMGGWDYGRALWLDYGQRHRVELEC